MLGENGGVCGMCGGEGEMHTWVCCGHVMEGDHSEDIGLKEGLGENGT